MRMHSAVQLKVGMHVLINGVYYFYFTYDSKCVCSLNEGMVK